MQENQGEADAVSAVRRVTVRATPKDEERPRREKQMSKEAEGRMAPGEGAPGDMRQGTRGQGQSSVGNGSLDARRVWRAWGQLGARSGQDPGRDLMREGWSVWDKGEWRGGSDGTGSPAGGGSRTPTRVNGEEGRAQAVGVRSGFREHVQSPAVTRVTGRQLFL